VQKIDLFNIHYYYYFFKLFLTANFLDWNGNLEWKFLEWKFEIDVTYKFLFDLTKKFSF